MGRMRNTYCELHYPLGRRRSHTARRSHRRWTCRWLMAHIHPPCPLWSRRTPRPVSPSLTMPPPPPPSPHRYTLPEVAEAPPQAAA
eukprot:5140943-Prymnesium_polylepis.1